MKNGFYKALILFLLSILLIFLGGTIQKIASKNRLLNYWVVNYIEEDRNLMIIIEVDKKLLNLYDLNDNSLIKTYTIATGKEDTPTPLGTFYINEKARWGGGFGSRWLGLSVPWGKYGIHGTNQPNSIGYNVSAGCIRMRNKDIEELFTMVNYNTIVNITRGLMDPFNYGFRFLKPGDIGADVLEVQKRLSLKGYYTGPLDGIYGEGMKAGLIKFLKDNNMELTDRIHRGIYEKLDIIIMD